VRTFVLLVLLVGACAPDYPPPRADGAVADADAAVADAAPPPDAPPPDATPSPPDAAPPDASCASGVLQDPNAQESEEMQPGVPCIACHVDSNATSGKGDAPVFTFAGTVYAFLHEPDLCEAAGSLGAEVTVDDALAHHFVAPVNAVGNFFVDDTALLVPPFTVTLRFHDRVETAEHEDADGECNRCHSATGDEDAPGRIILPPP
jgi:hypothetical protein